MPINFDHTGNIIVTDNGILNFNMTGAIQVPVGTTALRPTAASGMLRYNTTLGVFEGYCTSSWQDLSNYTISDITRYTTGSGTFTVASGVTKLIVKIVGGGGGGGGINGDATGHGMSAGGGAGAYIELYIDGAEIEASYSYVVGSGGGGGASGNNDGSAGSASTFNGTTNVASAAGGSGGKGGSGSAGSSNIPSIAGGNATVTGYSNSFKETGGRSQGARTISGSWTYYPAAGYSAQAPGAISNRNLAGRDGAFGSGGSGTMSTTSTNYAGGDGGAGYIEVKEYY